MKEVKAPVKKLNTEIQSLMKKEKERKKNEESETLEVLKTTSEDKKAFEKEGEGGMENEFEK